MLRLEMKMIYTIMYTDVTTQQKAVIVMGDYTRTLYEPHDHVAGLIALTWFSVL